MTADLAAGPGYPAPPELNEVSRRPVPAARRCRPCAIETTEPACFVCGLPTTPLGDR